MPVETNPPFDGFERAGADAVRYAVEHEHYSVGESASARAWLSRKDAEARAAELAKTDAFSAEQASAAARAAVAAERAATAAEAQTALARNANRIAMLALVIASVAAIISIIALLRH